MAGELVPKRKLKLKVGGGLLKTTCGSLLPHRKLSSELLTCSAFTESVKTEGRGLAETVLARQGSTGSPSKFRLHLLDREVLGLRGGVGYGLAGSQTLMSWDSTILASVFFTRRIVRREAGLKAQHSDISFSIARRH